MLQSRKPKRETNLPGGVEAGEYHGDPQFKLDKIG